MTIFRELVVRLLSYKFLFLPVIWSFLCVLQFTLHLFIHTVSTFDVSEWNIWKWLKFSLTPRLFPIVHYLDTWIYRIIIIKWNYQFNCIITVQDGSLLFLKDKLLIEYINGSIVTSALLLAILFNLGSSVASVFLQSNYWCCCFIKQNKTGFLLELAMQMQRWV